jgi:hypothetical protein
MGAQAYISRVRNHVAAIPVGHIWDYPIVHWMNYPNWTDESSKPYYVAVKYVRGMYEIDPMDFGQVQTEKATAMLSTRVAELFAYTIPGTWENVKVAKMLEDSQTFYRVFSEGKIRKRFLIDDVISDQPALPNIMRVELLGQFYMFGSDGRRPVPADDLGYKSIVLLMTKDIATFDRQDAVQLETKQKEEGKDGEQFKSLMSSMPKAVNPEGWYVIRSSMRTLTEKDLTDIRQMRLDAGYLGDE